MYLYAAIAAYGLPCLIFLGLALRAVLARGDILARRAVTAGCVASAMWAMVMLSGLTRYSAFPMLLDLAEIIRDAAWFNFLLLYLQRLNLARTGAPRQILIARVLGPSIFLFGLILILPRLMGPTLAPSFVLVAVGAKILVSVLGLWVIEMVVSRSGSAARWGVKHLAMALAAIFGFDLYFHSDLVLEGRLDPDLVIVRGLVGILAGPLVWISIRRIGSWAQPGDRQFNISPQAAMQGGVLIGSGLYLLVMAGLASLIPQVGGEWGGPLQALFLIGVVLLMVVAIGSGQFKSRIKVLFNKYFFTYKFDYREEWRRFIAMMATHRPLSLGERIVHAIADTMDSPAAALWLWQRADDAFIPDATWNYAGRRPAERGDSAFIGFLRDTGRVIEAGKNNAPEGVAEPQIPVFLREHPALWLIVPLIHRGDTLGFLALDRARAPRSLDWEDRDLLKTLGAHAASYLAEELAAEALSETQRLAEFNRRFAFVVHDVKNVVGQMSLIVQNAERHIDNPEFQQDMVRTVSNSVDRLKALLDQLSQKRREAGTTVADVDVRAAALTVAERWRKASTNFAADLLEEPIVARAAQENFVAALDLLIDNALGAITPDGRVVLRLRADDERAVIEVEDDGPGMEMDFVYKELFRPLRSTKSEGYGIGAYQTRQLVREMGGKLEVDTVPNRGTIMRIVLPLAVAGAVKPSV